MARWAKTADAYDADIEKSQAKIARYTTLLDNERIRLEELLSKKRDLEMQELYDFMRESGLSATEVLKALQDQSTTP